GRGAAASCDERGLLREYPQTPVDDRDVRQLVGAAVRVGLVDLLAAPAPARPRRRAPAPPPWPRPPPLPRASPRPAWRPWSATPSSPSCGRPTGLSPAPAAPPRSSASTPVRCGAGSRGSVFRTISPNSEGLVATCRDARSRPQLTTSARPQ